MTHVIYNIVFEDAVDCSELYEKIKNLPKDTGKQEFIQKFGTLSPIGYHTVYRPWTRVALFADASEWLDSFDREDAHWYYGSGRSTIDGKQYPAEVYFKHEEDFLMFKLKFGALLAW